MKKNRFKILLYHKGSYDRINLNGKRYRLYANKVP